MKTLLNRWQVKALSKGAIHIPGNLALALTEARAFGSSTDGKKYRLVNVKIFILLTLFSSLQTRWKYTGFLLQTKLVVWISLQKNTTVVSQLQYGYEDIWTKQVSSIHAGECHQACHHLGHSALPLSILRPACCCITLCWRENLFLLSSIYISDIHKAVLFPPEAQQSWQFSYWSERNESGECWLQSWTRSLVVRMWV